MTHKKNPEKEEDQRHLPDPEELARELAKAESIDDFYGKYGIFARMFSKTIEQMLEAELTEKLGYERYEAEGRNTGNSRNGHYTRKMRTSGDDAMLLSYGQYSKKSVSSQFILISHYWLKTIPLSVISPL